MNPGDEAVSFLFSRIDPRDPYNPRFAMVQKHIAAIRKAQADIGERAVGFPLDAGDAYLVNLSRAMRRDIEAIPSAILRNNTAGQAAVSEVVSRLVTPENIETLGNDWFDRAIVRALTEDNAK